MGAWGEWSKGRGGRQGRVGRRRAPDVVGADGNGREPGACSVRGEGICEDFIGMGGVMILAALGDLSSLPSNTKVLAGSGRAAGVWAAFGLF